MFRLKRYYTKRPKLKSIRQIKKDSAEAYRTYINNANKLTTLKRAPIYAHIFPLFRDDH